MNAEAPAGPHDLEVFRPLLRYLARLHLDPRLAAKLDAEDFVQETLLEAHQKLEQFRGDGPAQLKGWLRRILLNKLANAVQKFRTLKCDAGREQSLDAALEHSSARLEGLLAADQSTPGEQAQRAEQALRLEEALGNLPERQRAAVVLKHYHDWTLADISRHLNVTHAAVVGLLNRGLGKLRGVLGEPE